VNDSIIECLIKRRGEWKFPSLRNKLTLFYSSSQRASRTVNGCGYPGKSASDSGILNPMPNNLQLKRQPRSNYSCMGHKIHNVVDIASLIYAGTKVEDDTLYIAARSLNTEAINLLIQIGHDPSKPSIEHQGRSPLAGLCHTTFHYVHQSNA
jgi:hypothetical protein